MIEGREKKGLSQVALSRLLGRCKNFVWKYEHRERKLDLVDFSKIAAVLGIDVQGAVQEIGLHAYDAEQPTPSRTDYASTPDIVLDTALPFALVEADICTVDATWSALKFVTEKKVAPSALKRDR